MADPSFGRLKPSVRDFVPQGVPLPTSSSSSSRQQGEEMSTTATTTSPRGGVAPIKEFKEFVPGRGVVTGATSTISQQQQQQPREFVPGRGLVREQQPQTSFMPQQQQQQFFPSSQQHELHSIALASAAAAAATAAHQRQLMMDQYHEAASLAGPAGPGSRMLPRALETLPKRRTLNSALLPSSLRTFYAAQARVMNSSLPPDANELKELPPYFHSVLPLDIDPSVRNTAGSTGYPTAVYKAVNGKDGFTYAVRRVDNAKSIQNISHVQSIWGRVQHANVIPLRDAFVQNRALFLVHDFIPGAQTLREFITARNANGQPQLLPENVLWSILTQILSAVRAVHLQGLACRDLSPCRVLLTGRYRTRVSCAGIVHALEPTTMSLAEEQQEDILWIGQLALMLATMSLNPSSNFQASVEFIQQRYTAELVAFALHPFKLKHTNQRCNVYDLLALASQGLLAENDSLYAHGDALEEAVSRLYECDRLFRLMTKLSVITERPPEHGVKVGDSWSEVDERYVIKLFRDYVFHQTDDAGKPWLDVGHIIDCLNKLDIGSQETILLSSRDGRALLVVSYDDVRQSVEKAFQELLMMNSMHAQGGSSGGSGGGSGGGGASAVQQQQGYHR